MTENGWGKGRKINGRSAMANLVRDGYKELKQKCSQIESSIKKFHHANSPKRVSVVIHAFQKS
jgi:hypothetical protein